MLPCIVHSSLKKQFVTSLWPPSLSSTLSPTLSATPKTDRWAQNSERTRLDESPVFTLGFVFFFFFPVRSLESERVSSLVSTAQDWQETKLITGGWDTTHVSSTWSFAAEWNGQRWPTLLTSMSATPSERYEAGLLVGFSSQSEFDVSNCRFKKKKTDGNHAVAQLHI